MTTQLEHARQCSVTKEIQLAAQPAGLSFMAIHCGINQYAIKRLGKQGFHYG